MAFYANAPLPDTNARQVAQTIRMPSTSLLTIDSEDRFTDYTQARGDAVGNYSSTPYNFSISKSESLMNGFLTRCGITEVCFPWVIPNINVKTNSIQFVYQDGSNIPVVTSISLEYGFYTPHNLAQALVAEITQINPLLSAFTMEYGNTGMSNYGDEPLFTYASNNGTGVAFLPWVYNTAPYPFSSNTKQLFDLLGFSNNNALLTTSNNIGNYTLCQCTRYIDIVCNQLTNNQALKDQTSQTISRDMLCRIYLGDGGGTGQSTIAPSDTAFCPPGCAPMTIYRNFATPKQIQWIPNQPIPGYLSFQVFDQDGNPLDESVTIAQSGSGHNQSVDWSMTLMVSEN